MILKGGELPPSPSLGCPVSSPPPSRHRLYRGLSILTMVTPSSGEPTAGDLPVQYGGKGVPNLGTFLPLSPRCGHSE